MVFTSSLTIYEIAGIVGVLLHLGPYAVLQMGLMSGRGYLYPSLKALATLFVLVSLSQQFNASSVFIQLSFLAISILGIGRLFYLRQLRRYSEEERTFIQNALPGVDQELAGSLARMGVWSYAPAGTVLAQEGSKTTDFVYITDGEAEVSLNDIKIATIYSHSISGEVTCLEGAPATATVTLTKPCRIFRIKAEKLRAKARMVPDLKSQLQHCIRSGMTRKFATLNQEFAEAKTSTGQYST